VIFLFCEDEFAMRKTLSLQGVLRRLKQVQAGRTQAVLAKELGVSQGYLSDVLRGMRLPGPKMLAKIGLEMADTVRYRELEKR
jgi:transcriptional regulator with XRE-family HTH domain